MAEQLKPETLAQLLADTKHADVTLLYPELINAQKDYSESLPPQSVKLYVEAGWPPVVATFYGARRPFSSLHVIVNELFRLEHDFQELLNFPHKGPKAILFEFFQKGQLEKLELNINRFMLLALSTVDLKFKGEAMPKRKLAKLKMKLTATLMVVSAIHLEKPPTDT